MAAPRVSFSDKDMENGGEGGQERYVVVVIAVAPAVTARSSAITLQTTY